MKKKTYLHLFIGTCKFKSKRSRNMQASIFCEFMKNAGGKNIEKIHQTVLRKNGPIQNSQRNKGRNRNRTLKFNDMKKKW